MRRALCLLTLIVCCALAHAQGSLDFASKYMQQCEGDSTLQCITVGPKMMEQIIKGTVPQRHEDLMPLLEKLKSAQIVTALEEPEAHYNQAEALIKQHAGRFSHKGDFDHDKMQGSFYTRDDRDGHTVELVMLSRMKPADTFIIVNITGDIDQEFINRISGREE